MFVDGCLYKILALVISLLGITIVFVVVVVVVVNSQPVVLMESRFTDILVMCNRNEVSTGQDS